MVDGQLLSLEDGFSVFDKIPGTPRYWQQRRYDMIAKIEQLGAFQFFFTLSLADRRWKENFVSILTQNGVPVSFEKNVANPNGPDLVFANGIPLADYLAHENLHEMIRQNVLTVTRNFDYRIKAFMRNIVMGRNNAMRVQYYTYRIEFQARGAAHVHGVLWLNMDELDKDFPGIKKIMSLLQSNKCLSLHDRQLTANFIDKFITCSNTTEVSNIVEEVQAHHHTKSCKKYGSACRFQYPKYPSHQTIIAQPLQDTDFDSEEAFLAAKKQYKQVLNDVKTMIDMMVECDEDFENITLEQILDQVGVDTKTYHKALSISEKGLVVILKRSPAELFINNYNIEWLRAWNGNLDIQVCLDFFAVTTYITDYYTKDESGTTKLLQEAAKQNSDNLKEKMKCLAQVYLTHREMGESEAIYRIIPSLHLSESNVKCVFVATGFPWERSRFLRKILDQPDKSSCITLPDYEGNFQLATSIHEKYAGRPKALQHISLAQFAIWYDTLPFKQGEKLKFKDGITTLSKQNNHRIISWDDKEQTPFPLHLKLKTKDLGYMKLRSFPSVLRIHKFKPGVAPHEFFYSELLLYKAWQSEEELGFDDFDKCCTLYWDMEDEENKINLEQRKTYIEKVKSKLFPYRNAVEEARTLLELSPERASHIGDILDPENEIINEETNRLDPEEDELSAARDPGEFLSTLESPALPEKNKYQRVNIENLQEMYASVQSLAPEQKIVFDQVIQYCKNLRKACHSNRWQKPRPPLLKVHGGAGAGKSKLINDIAQWVEYFLRTDNNRNPNQPVILKVAPTGKAASLIQGMTLHHAFHFKFSNE